MSDGAKLWCFLLLIPFFLAIGHDLWANYYATQAQKTRLESFDIDPNAYQGSDLGYLLVSYTPGMYETARTFAGEDFWIEWVDPVLRMYTVVISLVPFMVFALWLLIARVFDLWPFESTRRQPETPLTLREERRMGKQIKYRRL